VRQGEQLPVRWMVVTISAGPAIVLNRANKMAAICLADKFDALLDWSRGVSVRSFKHHPGSDPTVLSHRRVSGLVTVLLESY
jgi:hypothetical protein